MHHDTRPIHSPLRSGPESLALLDTLSDAVIFLDKTATILSANERAGALIGRDKYELQGQILWQAAPQLVTTVFYQAVVNAIRTHTSFQVEYRSPVTRTWFHMYLAPTSEGTALFFQEAMEPTAQRDPISQRHEGYLDLLEDVSERIAILSPSGLLLEINQRSLTDAQVQREEVVGKPFIQFPSWSSVPVTQEQLRTAIEQAGRGERVHLEMGIRRQTGLLRDMALTLTPHRDVNQQVDFLIGIGRDITEHKHAEEARRALVDAIPQLIWIAGPDGEVTYNNQRMIDYLAMTLEQVKGSGWLVGVHPDDLQRVRDVWRVSVDTGIPYEVEHRLLDGTSGVYRWFLVRGVPQRDAQGTIQSWIGACTDIDDKKQAAERVEASEHNFRVLAETVPNLVWTAQPDGRVDYTNQRYRDTTQSDFEHLKGHGWRQFVHPDDRKLTVERRVRSLETGELYENEYRLRNSQTGEYHWFLARAYPVHDKAGQIIKWFGTSTDIDGQKRTEEALRHSQAQVQSLMASNVIGIGIAEGQEIIEANDTLLRMTGYSRDDLLAQRLNWMRMTAPEYIAVTEQVHRQLRVDEHLTPYEKEYVCKDGSRLPVLVGGVMTQVDKQEMIFFVLDNSARKALEQRKDTFISMASHELRTPLTALKMQMQILHRRLEKQGLHQAVTAVARVEEPVRQLERLVGELLDVSKMQAGKLEYIQEPVDLRTLLLEVVETMQQIHTTHTIVVDVAQRLIVQGDKDRLEQVVINLLSNAIKYSPAAKTVEIILSATPETATIRVCDYGAGIPQEQHKKIFERFYRVAGSKQEMIPGLGMGLYIVEEIVRQHSGTITVESVLGKGSTFYVTLPLKDE